MTTKYYLTGIVNRDRFTLHYINEPDYRVGLMPLCIDDDDWECRVWVKKETNDPHRWRNPRKVWSSVLCSMIEPGRFKNRQDALRAGREFLKWCRYHKAQVNALLGQLDPE